MQKRKIIILVSFLVFLFCFLFLYSGTFIRRNYQIGCGLKLIDSDLCQTLPTIITAIEEKDFHKILSLQEKKLGANCMGEQCDEQPLIYGYAGGAMNSEYFLYQEDEHLSALKKITKERNFKFFSLSRKTSLKRAQTGEIYFLDKKSKEVIALPLEKINGQWKITMFVTGNLERNRGYLDY